MLRTVLSVLLATALLSTALPAVEDARATRSDARVQADVAALDAALVELTSTEDAVEGGATARRVVTVSLPSASLTSAPVDYVAVGGSPSTNRSSRAGETLVAYRVDGEPERVVRVDVPTRTPGDGPLVLRGAGDRRLSLSLVAGHRGPAVAVQRETEV